MARRFLIASVVCLSLAHHIAAAEPGYGRGDFTGGEAEHWAFVPFIRPEIADVQRRDWVRTPIDAFVLAELENSGIEPAPIADRRTLLRRVYLDLIGLPPTPAEQQGFLHDDSPEAWPRVVDGLLTRPEYGERWARHWLDVVRYAESNGYERDGAKPNAWRYRDWVIDSLNSDMPYDRFVLEQLAGDEIEESNAKSQIATTFLRLGPWDDEPADPLIDRYDQLDDVLSATAATFMAVTLRCARCHDHKFEPFTQRDYARVLAIFEPLKRPQNERADLDRLVGTVAELDAYRVATAQADQRTSELATQIEGIEAAICTRAAASGTSGLDEPLVAALGKPSAERTAEQSKALADARAKLAELAKNHATEDERRQLDEWRGQVEAVKAGRPPEPPRAYVWYEEPGDPPPTHVFTRGNPATPVERIEPGLPAVLVDSPPSPPTPTASSSGRRLQLARWLIQHEHPLTARVMVNRVWQHHFGEGIVASENDFGQMGDMPSHPELLDWLASEFVAGGWRMKALHRLIVMSNTYQLSCAVTQSGLKNDPEARLLWRRSPQRLSAEAVRDSILAASGQLNSKRGGPSVFPAISASVLATQSRPGNGWQPSDRAEAARRSIYAFVKRTLPVPELEVLDFPNTNASCEQRTVSTIAPQALTYLNGEFINAQASHFAERLGREAGADVEAQITSAFELTVCRPPSPAEMVASREFLTAQEAQVMAEASRDAPSDAPTAAQQALQAFCLVMLNTNEFVYMP